MIMLSAIAAGCSGPPPRVDLDALRPFPEHLKIVGVVDVENLGIPEGIVSYVVVEDIFARDEETAVANVVRHLESKGWTVERGAESPTLFGYGPFLVQLDPYTDFREQAERRRAGEFAIAVEKLQAANVEGTGGPLVMIVSSPNGI